jgi:type IV secretory pathway VirB10-like protein
MDVSKTTVGMVAALCVALGAGGAYLVSGDGSGTEAATGQVSTAPVSDQPLGSTREAAGNAPALAPPVAVTATAARTARPGPAPRRPQGRSARTPSEAVADPSPQADPAPAPDAQTSWTQPEPIASPEPEPLVEAALPAREFEELVVSADSVIGLQLETSTTSEDAELEDQVIAHVTRDVRVDGKVAIPAGSKAHGEVTLVERGGRLRERARLGVRFTSLVLPDRTRVRLESETVYREGDAPSRESAAKIGGGAIGGAILGGIFGGAKGAAIGGSVGAGAGTAAVFAGGRNPATLPSGTPVTVRLTGNAIVTVNP